MRLIKASYEVLTPINGVDVLKNIETAGRLCYKSEGKTTDDSCFKFVKSLIARGHESVIEHQSFSVRFIVDRGVSHELVRHRLASFSQESTRYCNYSDDEKFGNNIVFIIPCWLNDKLKEGVYNFYEESVYDIVKRITPTSLTREELNSFFNIALFLKATCQAELSYKSLTQGEYGKQWTPQEARSVLPNALKTEIIITANLREWRTIFKQRTAKAAHPQMREVMIPLLTEIKEKIPVVFDDFLIVE
jgi:thymidylate synthase (FAD)